MQRDYNRANEDRPMSHEERIDALKINLQELTMWRDALAAPNAHELDGLPYASKVSNHITIMSQMMEIHNITYGQIGTSKGAFERLAQETERLAQARHKLREENRRAEARRNPVP